MIDRIERIIIEGSQREMDHWSFFLPKNEEIKKREMEKTRTKEMKRTENKDDDYGEFVIKLNLVRYILLKNY